MVEKRGRNPPSPIYTLDLHLHTEHFILKKNGDQSEHFLFNKGQKNHIKYTHTYIHKWQERQRHGKCRNPTPSTVTGRREGEVYH